MIPAFMLLTGSFAAKFMKYDASKVICHNQTEAQQDAETSFRYQSLRHTLEGSGGYRMMLTWGVGTSIATGFI